MVDWDSMGCVITQTRGRAFQTLGRAFSFLLNPQKLGRVFQMLDQVFEKLDERFKGSVACLKNKCSADSLGQRTH